MDTILIVDSDPAVRSPLAAYLRDCGLRVLEATDTTEAQAILSERAELVDAVLCDAGSLGTGSGFGLAQWVRQRYQRIPVLLAGTVEAAASAAGDLCEEGPALSKPYDHTAVADAIRQALANKARS